MASSSERNAIDAWGLPRAQAEVMHRVVQAGTAPFPTTLPLTTPAFSFQICYYHLPAADGRQARLPHLECPAHPLRRLQAARWHYPGRPCKRGADGGTITIPDRGCIHPSWAPGAGGGMHPDHPSREEGAGTSRVCHIHCSEAAFVSPLVISPGIKAVSAALKAFPLLFLSLRRGHFMVLRKLLQEDVCPPLTWASGDRS